MADVKFEPVLAQMPTSAGGTLDVAAPVGFGQPKAIMVLGQNNNGTLDSVGTNYNSSIGYADGTNQSVVVMQAVSTLTASEPTRYHSTDSLLVRLQPGTTTGLDRLNFNQWLPEGVRLDVGAASAAANYFTVVFIGGAGAVSYTHLTLPTILLV